MRKDSSRRGLQTNEKIFQIFRILFELTTFFLNNGGVEFMHAWRGRHLC